MNEKRFSLHSIFVSLFFFSILIGFFASLRPLWLYSLKTLLHMYVCVCLEPGFWYLLKQDSLLGITVASLVLYPGYMKMASIISVSWDEKMEPMYDGLMQLHGSKYSHTNFVSYKFSLHGNWFSSYFMHIHVRIYIHLSVYIYIYILVVKYFRTYFSALVSYTLGYLFFFFFFSFLFQLSRWSILFYSFAR